MLLVIISFFGCAKKQIISDDLSAVISAFYLENQNEAVIDNVKKHDFFKADNYENVISKLIYAAALCEDQQIDSAYSIIINLNFDRNFKDLDFWYNSIYGLYLFRADSLTKSYSTLSKTTKFPNTDIRARALNKRIMARISLKLGDYRKGVEWLLLSTELFEKSGLPKSVGVNCKILGRYFMNSNNFTDALDCFNKAEKLFKQTNDSVELFYIYINLLDYYLEIDSLNNAEEYAHKSKEFSGNLEDYQMITLAYNNLGEIELKRGNLDKAKSYFFKTLTFGSNYTSAVTRKINTYSKLADIFKTENNLNLAQNYADSALLLLPISGYHRMKSRLYSQIAQINHNKSKEAFYLGLSNKYLDSAFISLSKTTKAFYEAKSEQVKTEMEFNDYKNSETRNKRIGLTLVIAVVAVLFTFYYNQSKRSKLLKILVDKNLKIIDEERKMNVLLNEKAKKKTSLRKNSQNAAIDKVFTDFICWLEADRNYSRNEINLETASREINTNREYLSRAISEQNLRFIDIVNKYRIDEIISIFTNPADKRNYLNLKFLATEVGFNSDSVFIEAFRRQTGMTPAQFRKSLYKNDNV